MLTKNDFIHEFKRLSLFFGKPQTPEQLEIWFDRCKFLSAPILADAVNLCIDNEKFFPTPKILLEKADLLKSQEITRQNSVDWKTASKVVIGDVGGKIGEYGPEYVKESRELFGKAMRCELLGYELSEAMYDMEKKWPGKGWKENADEVLDKFIKKMDQEANEMAIKRKNLTQDERKQKTNTDARGVKENSTESYFVPKNGWPENYEDDERDGIQNFS